LALVLGAGGRIPARDLALALLETWGSIGDLAQARAAALLRIPGFGRVRAGRLVASLELGRRAQRAPLRLGTAVRGPRDLVPTLTAMLGRRQREHFVAVYLDARHRVLAIETVSVGSIAASLVHPREVFRPAVAVGATAVVVAHNHPSGSAEPSRDDIALTERLVRCGRLLGIEVIDHLVVGAGAVTSLRELHWPGGDYR
jgi:DNA repair protein RadC